VGIRSHFLTTSFLGLNKTKKTFNHFKLKKWSTYSRTRQDNGMT